MREPLRTWLLSLCLAILIVPGGLYVAGLCTGIAGGENWKIGYYGRFNRVKAVIEAIPGIHVVDSWKHEDVTLEDFTFTLVSNSGQTAKIGFWENSPQMEMTNPREIEAYVRE